MLAPMAPETRSPFSAMTIGELTGRRPASERESQL
jgi:hypothetical protein